jgi:hypothetical protein
VDDPPEAIEAGAAVMATVGATTGVLLTTALLHALIRKGNRRAQIMYKKGLKTDVEQHFFIICFSAI